MGRTGTTWTPQASLMGTYCSRYETIEPGYLFFFSGFKKTRSFGPNPSKNVFFSENENCNAHLLLIMNHVTQFDKIFTIYFFECYFFGILTPLVVIAQLF